MPDSTPPAATPASSGNPGRWEPPSPAELQALMQGYKIEKLLGRGGMGAVYKGVQENLDRTVAIKILPPGMEQEDPTFAERFKNEARLMAKLLHPAVVAVFDFGTTLGGQLYIAMEYVDGTDVSQMIHSQKKLPADHALAITAHVCDALSAAHELGIVHRDIKPANVLINMKGQVKVADFGLAKMDDPGTHGLTKTGYAMGTPDFVAPEALMLGTAVDGRADLYAVGVMLYQMLTGQIPRGAWHPASVISPGTDHRFDEIIVKAMQYDRDHRYQSSAELRQDLDIILTVPLARRDEPAAAAVPAAEMAQVPAQRSAAQKPVGKPPQKRPASAAAQPKDARKNSHAPLLMGLGVAAALGIGAFVMLSGSKSEVGPPSHAAPAADGTAPKAGAVHPYLHREDKRGLGDLPKGEWIPVHFTPSQDQAEFYTVVSADTLKQVKAVHLNSFCKDVALRMKVKRPIQSTEDAVMQLRLESRGARDLRFRLTDTVLVNTLAGSSSFNRAARHDRSLATTSHVLLEAAAIGDMTYGAVDGSPLVPLALKSELLAPGRMRISAPGGEITGIEFMLLDGVAEDKYPGFVKASLKTSGKAVPSSHAPSSAAPAPRLSASTEPWQDALSKLHLSGGAELTAEGLRITNGGSATLRDMGPRRDGAVRMRAVVGSGRVELRARSGRLGGYLLCAENPTKVRLSFWSDAANSGTTLYEHVLPVALQPGQSYELELRVVGQTLTAKFNGVVIGTATDASASEGSFGVGTGVRTGRVAVVTAVEVLDLSAATSSSPTSATRPRSP